MITSQFKKRIQNESRTTDEIIWSQVLTNYFKELSETIEEISEILLDLDSEDLVSKEIIEQKQKKKEEDRSLQNTEYEAEDTPITLLQKTLGLYRRFVGKQDDVKRMYSNENFCFLMDLLLKQMKEADDVLKNCKNNRQKITNNFEIIEQTLRRYTLDKCKRWLSVSFCSRNDCVDSRDTEQSEC
jgi:hypothetical protein